MTIITVDITKEMKERSEYRAKTMGKLKNSVERGETNVYGFIGEEAVAHYLGVPIIDTYEYDLIYRGVKIDVKTQVSEFKPSSNYEVTVYNFNTNQQCNIYVFARVQKTYMNYAWICGWQGKEEFFQKATLRKKGDIDLSNNYRYKEDKWNLSISSLRDLEKIKLAFV